MNNDLISRKYIVRELLKEREHYPAMVAERYSFGVKLPHRFNQAMRGGIRKALRIAETAPAIDAEPVTRCNRCKYYEIDTGFCYAHGHGMDWVGYCSCGAKMDGDNDAAD